MPHPEGYRKALRLMKQADKFNRPIICFIDTKGAYPGKAAEERGQSEAIAKNLLKWRDSPCRSSRSSSGKAAAGSACARRRKPLIDAGKLNLFGDLPRELLLSSGRIQDSRKAAETMKITAPDLKELDIIDHVIKEVRGGAHRDVEQQAAYIDEALKGELKSC